MLREIKRLGKEAAVYGLSTVVGRLLNILLLPLYTHCLSPGEYGVVATVFVYIAFLNVLYGHGMDFAFMRHSEPRERAFATAFWSLAGTSLAMSLFIHAFATPLAALADLPPGLPDLARYAAWILAFDALALVPFAELRMSGRAGLYAGIKVANIVMNLALNYVFLVRLGMGPSGVFLASLLSSCATFAMLSPLLLERLSPAFDAALWKDLLRFALPLIPAGLASMVVQVIDRPILKFLSGDEAVGLYQANYRLAILMMLFVNMFDAAWRPFFIQRAGREESPKVLAGVMTYFVLAGSWLWLLIWLFAGPVVSLPLLGGRPLIHEAYWPALGIVPVVALGYLFNGVYVNLLAAPTLALKSELVAYATGLGALVNVGGNLLLIPRWGLMGAAAATLAAYAAMAASLWIAGRRVYRIDYEWGRLLHIAACLGAVSAAVNACGLRMMGGSAWLRWALLFSFPMALGLTGFFNDEERLAFRGWFSGRQEGPGKRG